jgi:NADH-quinone oxidoreductase subunit L
VVTLPLILLAIPSIAIGFLTVQPMLFGGFFDGAIFVKPEHDMVARIGEHFGSPLAFGLHGFMTPAFWLALGGFVAATLMYLLKPDLAVRARSLFAPVAALLERKYGFDDFYQAVFMRGSVLLGRGLWRVGDVGVIDDGIVNGSANLVDRVAAVVRRAQSGFLYHYAFSMILGLIVLLGFFAWPR